MKKVNLKKLWVGVLSVIAMLSLLFCVGVTDVRKNVYATTENSYGFQTDYTTADWVGVVSRLPISDGATSVTFKYKITEQSCTLSVFLGIARGTFTRNANNGAANIDYFRINTPTNYTKVGAEYTVTMDLGNFANTTISGIENGAEISGLTLPTLTTGTGVTNDHVGLLLLGANYTAKYEISCYDNLGKDLQITTLSIENTALSGVISQPNDTKTLSTGSLDDTTFVRTGAVLFANGNRTQHSLINDEAGYVENDEDLKAKGSVDGNALRIDIAGASNTNNWLMYSFEFGGKVKVSEMGENEKLALKIMSNFGKGMYLFSNDDGTRATASGVVLTVLSTNIFTEYYLTQEQCLKLADSEGYITGLTIFVVGESAVSAASTLYIDEIYVYEEYVNDNPVNYTFTADYTDNNWLGVVSRLPVSSNAKKVYFNYKIIEQNQAPTVLSYARGTFTKRRGAPTVNTDYLRANSPANLYIVGAEYTVVFNLSSFGTTAVYGKTVSGETITIPALTYNVGTDVTNDHLGLFLVGSGYNAEYQISCYDDTGKDLQLTTLSASNSSVANVISAPENSDVITNGTVEDTLYVGVNITGFAPVGEVGQTGYNPNYKEQHSLINAEASYIKNDEDLKAKGSVDGNALYINLAGANNAQNWLFYSMQFGGKVKVSELSEGSKLSIKMFSTATRSGNTPIYLFPLHDNTRKLDNNAVSVSVTASRVFTEYELTLTQMANLTDEDGYFSGFSMIVIGAASTQDAKIYIDEIKVKDGAKSIDSSEYNGYFKAYYNTSTKKVYSIVKGEETPAVINIITDKENIQSYPCVITNAGKLVYENLSFDISKTVLTVDDVQCYVLKESYNVKVHYANGNEDSFTVNYEGNYLLKELQQTQIPENYEFVGWQYGNGEEVDFNAVVTQSIDIYEKQIPVQTKSNGCNSSLQGDITLILVLFAVGTVVLTIKEKKVCKK